MARALKLGGLLKIKMFSHALYFSEDLLLPFPNHIPIDFKEISSTIFAKSGGVCPHTLVTMPLGPGFYSKSLRRTFYLVIHTRFVIRIPTYFFAEPQYSKIFPVSINIEGVTTAENQRTIFKSYMVSFFIIKQIKRGTE